MQGGSTNNGDPGYSREQREALAQRSKQRQKHQNGEHREAEGYNGKSQGDSTDDQLDGYVLHGAEDAYEPVPLGNKAQQYKHQHINLKQIHQQNAKS